MRTHMLVLRWHLAAPLPLGDLLMTAPAHTSACICSLPRLLLSPTQLRNPIVDNYLSNRLAALTARVVADAHGIASQVGQSSCACARVNVHCKRTSRKACTCVHVCACVCVCPCACIHIHTGAARRQAGR